MEQTDARTKELWEMIVKETLEARRQPSRGIVIKPNLYSMGKGILEEGMSISGIPAREIPGWKKY